MSFRQLRGKDIPPIQRLPICFTAAMTLRQREKNFDKEFELIKDRYYGIISDLGLELSLEEEFTTIKACFIGKAGRDYAASRGEYLNGIVLAEYLGYEFVDAADVIFFNDSGVFDSEKTNELLSAKLAGIERAVVPGFYGSMPNDTIKTFSRERFGRYRFYRSRSCKCRPV